MKTHSLYAVLSLSLSFVACTAVQAQESLFLAHVQRVMLAPPGVQFCSDLCVAGSSVRQPDGSIRVCVSNDGGCQKTEVQVDRVLLGDLQPGPHTFDNRIGEWGGMDFPVTERPILVHVKQSLVEWAPVTIRDGQPLVRVKAFRHGGKVAGVDLRAFARNDEDEVPLATLTERLPAGR